MTRRDQFVLVVGVVAVAGLALAVPRAAGPWLRAVLWGSAGVALWARASLQPGRPATFRLLGGAALAVGAAWAVLATGDTPRPEAANLQLLVPGVAGIGLATLVATPSWRQRASLLDGVVLAIGCGIGLPAVVGVEGVNEAVWIAAAVLSFAAALGPAILLASPVGVQSGRLPTTVLSGAGLVLVGLAGWGTADAVLTGGDLGPVSVVAWAVAPVLGLGAAWLHLSFAGSGEQQQRRPTPLRLVALAFVALLPTILSWLLAPELQVAGLIASVFAMIIVAARVAVSARFDIEDARAAADVRFDALVEHAAEVLALLDERGRIFYVSRAVEQTFDVPADDVLGLSPIELVHPDDADAVAVILAEAAARPRTPVHARIRLMDGHGTARHVDATVVDLRAVSGVGAISLTVRDVTERVALEAELLRQARTDSLTGLVKRAVLMDRIDHVMTARRPRAALLFVDLDDFKLVNDAFGHGAGDKVLVALAARLRSQVRGHDTASRVGGDEFAVLLEELEGDDPAEAAVRTAHRIAEAARQPIEVEGEPVEIGMSIGVALPREGMSTVELFTAADAAMYEAKRDKRGVVVYEDGMRTSSRSRLRLMRDVRAAIVEDTLDMAYQPIVDARTGALDSVEALLRWDHPVLGPVAPDVVLDHADAGGLTPDLTHRIIAMVGADLRHWRDVTGTWLPVSINLSAQQLVHVDPEQALRELLGVPRAEGRVTIEVTETSMLGDLAAAAQVLGTFRDAGCRIAIDDFGTGYASIGYLRRLPVDRLKIDREFVSGVTPATVRGSFAAVIHGLAVALGLTTIAEGVESEQQLAAVRAIGCELVQGYHVSHPLQIAELLDWAVTRGVLSDLA